MIPDVVDTVWLAILGISACGLVTMTLDILDTLLGAVLAFSAFAAVLISRRGLNTWRDQQRGSTVWDLSRKLLKEIYLLQSEVDAMRYPLQIIDSGEPDPNEEPEETWSRANREMYAGRLTQLSEHLTEARVLAVEIRAINKGKTLEKLVNELSREIQRLPRAISEEYGKDSRGRQGSSNNAEERHRIIYSHEGSDPYGDKLNAIIGKIEEECREHMK